VQEIDVKIVFGAAVRTWRKRLGFSQEVLAERADLHRTYVSDVERGARNLSLESMTRIAQALRISAADLFSPGFSDGKAGVGGNRGHDQKPVDILLVEANRADVEWTLQAFEKVRLANLVHVVGNGQEALDYLFCKGNYAARPGGRPQLVLLDLSLPKISGLEVLRRLKADKQTREIPVIILTISPESRDLAKCQRLGADTHLVKPLNFQQLCQLTPRLNLNWALLKAMSPSAFAV